mgnify:CR=1 FL=1
MDHTIAMNSEVDSQTKINGSVTVASMIGIAAQTLRTGAEGAGRERTIQEMTIWNVGVMVSVEATVTAEIAEAITRTAVYKSKEETKVRVLNIHLDSDLEGRCLLGICHLV